MCDKSTDVYNREGFPGGTSGKEPTCQSRRHKRYGFNPWVRRSPGGGHGSPLQYSCLENPMDKGAWRATVHRVTKNWTWLKLLGKGIRQGCILSLSLFNLHAEYVMQNAGLDGSQAGLKIAGRNINKLRHADDTPLVAESEKELKSLLMRVKEEGAKAGLKLNIKKQRPWHQVPSLRGK